MPRGHKSRTSSSEARMPIQQIAVSMWPLPEDHSRVGANQKRAGPN